MALHTPQNQRDDDDRGNGTCCERGSGSNAVSLDGQYHDVGDTRRKKGMVSQEEKRSSERISGGFLKKLIDNDNDAVSYRDSKNMLLAHAVTCARDDATTTIGESGHIVKEFLLSAPFFDWLLNPSEKTASQTAL